MWIQLEGRCRPSRSGPPTCSAQVLSRNCRSEFKSMLARVAGLPIRVLRHVFTDQSYESYYSCQTWEQKYRDEQYDLTSKKEDARYGALLRVLHRYDRGT